MTWFDVVALLLLVLIAWLESVRGFGRALFDLVGGIISLKLAPAAAMPLAASVTAFSDKGANQAFWLALVFLVFVAIVLVIARLVYSSTLLSLDYLDPLVGGFFGVIVGIIVIFFFLRVLQLAYGPGEQEKRLVGSFAGQEVLQLRSYHTVVNAMHHLGDTGDEVNEDVKQN